MTPMPKYAATEEVMVSNENADLYIAPQGTITNPDFPDIAEINSMLNAVDIVPFANITFPHAAASNSSSFPMINTDAQASKRSDSQYEAGLQVVYPRERLDTTLGNLQVTAANMIRATLQPLDIVTRLVQSPAGDRQPVKAGDLVSVFAFKTSKPNVPQPSGDDPYIIETAKLMPDGRVVVDTIAIDGQVPTEPVILTGDSTVTAGKTVSLFAHLYGHNISYSANWRVLAGSESARVDNMGVVHGLKAGTATIEVSHPSGVAASISIDVTAAAIPTLTSIVMDSSYAGVAYTPTSSEIVGAADLDAIRAMFITTGDRLDVYFTVRAGIITLVVPKELKDKPGDYTVTYTYLDATGDSVADTYTLTLT